VTLRQRAMRTSPVAGGFRRRPTGAGNRMARRDNEKILREKQQHLATTIRVGIPLSRPDNLQYRMGDVARMLWRSGSASASDQDTLLISQDM
jgi:hypothetical protein